MPAYDPVNLVKRLGREKGGIKKAKQNSGFYCGINGEHGVATRLDASVNVKAILEAVAAGLDVGAGQTVAVKRVLATGYTAADGGWDAAATHSITILDLPVMQKYWVARLTESRSEVVDHLRVRPRAVK
jgi:hypothetical protein